LQKTQRNYIRKKDLNRVINNQKQKNMTTQEKMAQTLKSIEDTQLYVKEQLELMDKMDTLDRRLIYVFFVGYLNGTLTSVKQNLESI
jgi:hypothetical protein